MPADQNVRVREPGVVPEVPGEGLELLVFEVRVDSQTGRRDQRRESKRRAFALGRVGRREEVVEPERVAPALASWLEVPEVPDVGLGAGLAGRREAGPDVRPLGVADQEDGGIRKRCRSFCCQGGTPILGQGAGRLMRSWP